MKRFHNVLQTLSAQLILGFILVVLLTAVASWFPEIWLIREQLERQAWAQVEQGQQTGRALYRNWGNELNGLAILTSRLPRLQALLVENNPEALDEYLLSVNESLEFDLLLLCAESGQPIARAGPLPTEALCARDSSSEFFIVEEGGTPQVWLLTTRPMEEAAASGVNLVVGVALDEQFVQEMKTHTGLEHSILVDNQMIVTTLEAPPQAEEELPPPTAAQGTIDEPPVTARRIFRSDATPFYASHLALDPPRLAAEVALDVSSIVRTEQRLIRTETVSILLVTIVGSLVGIALAQRISRPLSRLAEATSRLSEGNLDEAVVAGPQVREVAMVAHALEQSRRDLRGSLMHLQREKEWTDQLLEAIVEGIVTLDEHGYVTFWSQGAERITGWSQREALYQECDKLFDPVATEEPFTKLIPPPGQRRKISVTLRDGQQAILSVTRAQLTRERSPSAAVALVFRDVSDEEAVQRVLGHFMANVTHEFRTPLTALAAAIELLLDQVASLSQEELEELLLSLHLGILGLHTLVDNLLESASLETGRFRVFPRPTDLGEIVGEAIRTMQPLLDKYDQHLVVELPAPIPLVQADPRRTVQVLVNLLSNAGKYGPENAEVTIGATLQDDGCVRVMVADQGPGVPEARRGDLFRRFAHFSTNSDTSRYGTGLGLWVVKSVVEAHGGEVGVEERSSGGSIFWFTLPIAEEL